MAGILPEVNEAAHFAESVRLLWEATQRVVYGGIDTDDLVELCSIVVRLAEHRLSRLQAAAGFADSSKSIEQLRESRDSALKVLEAVKAPAPEPDWSAVAAALSADGAAPLEYLK